MLSDLIHVVLVKPAESLNVGSVARAMKNLGFVNLHLVTPDHYNRTKAAITACWATDLLDSITIHDSLEAALGPMERVVGFTSRQGKNRTSNFMLGDWAGKFREEPTKTALLFGPEDTGLTHEHLEHCSAYIRIPAHVEYPSFNLAQAVLLALYEINGQILTKESPLPTKQPAQASDFYQLDRIVDSVLTESGFTREGSPEPIPGMIRNLMRRTDPDRREMGILLAMFSRIERALKRL
jgi:TrmH family RNA methyltransferase